MNNKAYCVRFDYKGEASGREFFSKIAEFLVSWDELNQVLVDFFNPSFETQAQIDYLENGSIKAWLCDVLVKIDDANIRRYVNNPKEAIIDVLISIKHKILKAVEEKDCENLPALVEQEIKKSELKAYGYGINKPKLLKAVSKLTKSAKEFKNHPMVTISGISYELKEDYNYDLLKDARTQISRLQSEFIIKKPDLAGDSKWEIITDRVIKAKIDDDGFIKDLKSRKISLACGDKIKATLLTTTHIDENLEIIDSEHSLIEIQGIIKPCAQGEPSLPLE